MRLLYPPPFREQDERPDSDIRYVPLSPPSLLPTSPHPPTPLRRTNQDKKRSGTLTHYHETEGTTATAALEKGLQDLEDLCDVVSEEFWAARDTFNANAAAAAAAASRV